MNRPPIQTASVKVMRSHDYCHFEVALSVDADQPTGVSLTTVNDLRKEAMRLADKAVEQYKIAKQQRLLNVQGAASTYEIHQIRAKAETDRSPEEQATLKAYNDEVFAASREYDYQDDWQD